MFCYGELFALIGWLNNQINQQKENYVCQLLCRVELIHCQPEEFDWMVPIR